MKKDKKMLALGKMKKKVRMRMKRKRRKLMLWWCRKPPSLVQHNLENKVLVGL
jgi:hypothetical protein